MMTEEIKTHLVNDIIPFWKGLRDDRYGGYYGWLGYDLVLDREAVKGCILNSRILWFFSNAYLLLGDESLLAEARHSYAFLRRYCMDREQGGVYWSLAFDGTPEDTTKHTYNQAFAVYALSSYYDASGDEEALAAAMELFRVIEERCADETGYREAFDREFHEIENDKLSENGVMADRTMNTLLHVFEAYTELYRVSGGERVRERLLWLLDTIADKVYNPALHRQEVFFDRGMRSILDLHSYGHDIEAAWLLERGLQTLENRASQESDKSVVQRIAGLAAKIRPIILDLTGQVYKDAFDGHSLANECERGVVDERRIWWVQAEAVVGFLNGYQLAPERREYLEAAEAEWEFIKAHIIDPREGSEWYQEVDAAGVPTAGEPIVEPWKCPYHNGRMCMEVVRRNIGDL